MPTRAKVSMARNQWAVHLTGKINNVKLGQTIIARGGDDFGPWPGRNIGRIYKAPNGDFVLRQSEVAPYGRRCI
jgi:hypothetical protein